jgi:hypothetical protein
VAETPKQAEKKLRRLADLVAAGLRKRYGESGFIVFAASPYKVETLGDGPAFLLAQIHNSTGRVDLWLDYSLYWGGEERRVWFGAYSNRRMVKELITHQGALTKTGNYVRAHGRFERFEPPLSDREFGKTIVEDYGARQAFVGVYARAKVGTPTLPRRLVSWTRAWLPLFLAKEHATRNAAEELVAKEGGLKHYRSERRARSRWLAQQRKNRDGFRCAVCELKMADFYGAPGHRYAEAHHLDGLAKKKTERKIHVQRLITVCPNCHRMLHRMRDPADWKGLRRLIEKHGRYGIRNSRAGRR